MDQIVKYLWLGSQRDADELARKNPEGITAILNVRGPDAYEPQGRNQSIEHPGKAYKWIPAPDTGVVSARHVKDAVSPVYYVAGPPEMVKGLKTMISEAGVDDDDIRAEEFAGY